MNLREKALTIINHYGIMAQLKYFQSEVFELNEAIINAENNRLIGICREPSELAIEHIAEEIGDVRFMLLQFQSWYGIKDEEIEEVMNFKGDRQLKRIEEEK